MDQSHPAGARPAPSRPVLSADSVPRLPRHVRLRHDRVRDRWVILAPERVLVPDDIAVAVLQRIDGTRSVRAIAEDLAAAYDAPAGVILTDILPLLQDLADKAFLLTER